MSKSSSFTVLAIEFLSHNMYKQEIIESRKAVTLGNQYLAVSLENNSLDHHKLWKESWKLKDRKNKNLKGKRAWTKER